MSSVAEDPAHLDGAPEKTPRVPKQGTGKTTGVS
jgi:hypothetical protein